MVGFYSLCSPSCPVEHDHPCRQQGLPFRFKIMFELIILSQLLCKRYYGFGQLGIRIVFGNSVMSAAALDMTPDWPGIIGSSHSRSDSKYNVISIFRLFEALFDTRTHINGIIPRKN
eukprot:506652_1